MANVLKTLRKKFVGVAEGDNETDSKRRNR
jgi:hypothetical protein